jgi:hypothetical protein
VTYSKKFRRYSAAVLILFSFLTVGCGEKIGEISTDRLTSLEVGGNPDFQENKSLRSNAIGSKPATKKGRSIAVPKLKFEQVKKVEDYSNRLNERKLGSKASVSLSGSLSERSSDELLGTVRSLVADVTERVAAMVELGGRDDPQVVSLLREVAMSSMHSAAERVVALEALAELPLAEHLPAVAAALAADDEAVQTAGVWLLTQIQSDAAIALWQKVMAHPSEQVVAFAFEGLAAASIKFQEQAAVVAVRRAEPWIRERAIVTLGGITSKLAVEALIPWIDDARSGDLAHDGLMFLLGESFESSTAARRWWLRHQQKLDGSLQLIE